MPELPDIVVYLERLDALIARQPLEHIHILNPFVLRSITPVAGGLGGIGLWHYTPPADRGRAPTANR